MARDHKALSIIPGSKIMLMKQNFGHQALNSWSCRIGKYSLSCGLSPTFSRRKELHIILDGAAAGTGIFREVERCSQSTNSIYEP
jgi:hypothetical protein